MIIKPVEIVAFVQDGLVRVLEDRGFERPVIMAALSMEKTQLSKVIAIGRAVPAAIVQAWVLYVAGWS